MSINKICLSKESLEKILRPINKISESCVLKGKNNFIQSVCGNDDKSVILYIKLKLSTPIEESFSLNLICIKRLLSGLNCLDNNGNFSILLFENYIKCENIYNSQKTHFKYHLVDDEIIKPFPLNLDTVTNLSFNTEFNLSSDKSKKILASSSFATDANKVYFLIKDNILTAEVNDKTLSNIDNISIPITDKWIGDDLNSDFPISLEIFKNLVSFKNDIKVKINTDCNVAVFNIVEDDFLELKYIVSALIK